MIDRYSRNDGSSLYNTICDIVNLIDPAVLNTAQQDPTYPNISITERLDRIQKSQSPFNDPLFSNIYNELRAADENTKLWLKFISDEKNKICGPKGTAISFLNNTYHKVNVLERGYRDVINIRVKPTLNPAPEYANEKWTTGFEHSGVVNMDPEKAWTKLV